MSVPNEKSLRGSAAFSPFQYNRKVNYLNKFSPIHCLPHKMVQYPVSGMKKCHLTLFEQLRSGKWTERRKVALKHPSFGPLT